jgi:hypothetical protein
VPREPCKRITRRDGEIAARGKGEGFFFEGGIAADLEEMAERPTGEAEGESGGDHPFMSTASKNLRTLRSVTINESNFGGTQI